VDFILDIPISGRRGGSMLAQSGFDSKIIIIYR
jgi:hypothetical protein